MTVSELIFAYEAQIRLGIFIGVLVLFGLLEAANPRRKRNLRRGVRWLNNLGLVALNTVVLRLLFPAAAVGAAVMAEQQGWGLLNQWPVPYAVAVAATVIAMDLIVYLQHVMFHAVPALWRLHRVHHADLDFDLTTGLRFHPIEIILSMVLKLGAVTALGAPALGVLIFEVLLNATAIFNHSNLRLPRGLDRVLRWIVVTPDMHRVHHSVEGDETNSNFGFNLPWWDRLLGTYRDQPRKGHEGMAIGIHSVAQPRTAEWLDGMLVTIPFRGGTPEYPINQRFKEKTDDA
ncbi:sterol desaturase family protein [Thiohalorhabdus sp.]|uniref:sterol desaturase family protein n=1 Tax=Thiohalorhabdus sp. TaxID=3094134 RepID=UPI003FCD6AFF